MNIIPPSALRLPVVFAFRRHRPLAAVLFPLLAAGCLLSSAQAQTVTSVVPGLISYQGKITNSAGALVGAGTPVNRLVIFRIWGHQTNSTVSDLLYSEQQTVTISEGEFSVLIGQGTSVSGTPLGYSEAAKGPPTVTFATASVFGGAARYLGVTIDDGTTAADPEVSPRQQLVSTAYALRAKFAESIGANGATTITALDNGNVGIGTANPSVRLDINGVVNVSDGGAKSYPGGIATEVGGQLINIGMNDSRFGTATTAQPGGFLRIDPRGTTFGGDLYQFFARAGGSASAAQVFGISATGNVGIGQGLAGFPLTFASALGDKISLYGNSGAHYGFGIQGGLLQIHADTSAADVAFGYGSSSAFTETMRVKGNGNVGIGTSAPSAKLEVNGSIKATSLATGSLTLSGPLQASGAVTTHTQGAYLEWNKDTASGYTSLLNQRGLGSGGIVFGEVDSANTVTEAMRITAAGNVGINQTSPGAKLEVISSDSINTAFISNTGGGAGTQPALRVKTSATSGARNVIQAENSNGTFLVARDDGRVGIGVVSPNAPLHVKGLGTTGSITAEFNFTSGTNNSHVHWGASGDIYWRSGLSTGKVILQDTGGQVGIGTSTPVDALVHINGGVDKSGWVGGYLNPGGAGSSVTHGNHNTSLRASGTIVSGNSFIASSDSRIKTIMGRSDAAKDLQILLGIEITDFRYKDTISHGAGLHKKVIAQQVEKVYPLAVTSGRDVVPDYFKQAPVEDGWVKIANDLKPGDRIRLISEAGDDVFEVLEASPTRFRANLALRGEKVFVWGREVKDFRTVDYEAISMLNVSATQQIKREKDAEVAALRSANEALAARVAELEAKDRARDAKFAAIEKLLQANQTVMARPAAVSQSNANGQE